jgi:hypothetical protein
MCKRYYRTILIVLTVACGLSALVTAPIVLLTAAMGFDGPESEYQVWAWIVFIVVLSIPLWFVIGAIGGWVLYLHGWLRTSLTLAGATIDTPRLGDALKLADPSAAGGNRQLSDAENRNVNNGLLPPPGWSVTHMRQGFSSQITLPMPSRNISPATHIASCRALSISGSSVPS